MRGRRTRRIDKTFGTYRLFGEAAELKIGVVAGRVQLPVARYERGKARGLRILEKSALVLDESTTGGDRHDVLEKDRGSWYFRYGITIDVATVAKLAFGVRTKRIDHPGRLGNEEIVVITCRYRIRVRHLFTVKNVI
jgi:hypothetical protein